MVSSFFPSCFLIKFPLDSHAINRPSSLLSYLYSSFHYLLLIYLFASFHPPFHRCLRASFSTTFFPTFHLSFLALNISYLSVLTIMIMMIIIITIIIIIIITSLYQGTRVEGDRKGKGTWYPGVISCDR